MPPFEILNYMFTISKDSPSGLIWKNSNSPSIKPGHIAGSLCKDNYWQVKITHNKLRLSYQVHRIIYYLHTKINPDQLLIDHVNDKQNIIENLRLATHTENTPLVLKSQDATAENVLPPARVETVPLIIKLGIRTVLL